MLPQRGGGISPSESQWLRASRPARRLSVAREAALLVPFDLVLLDRTLPDGDGLSLVPMLQASNPGLPIIVPSAGSGVSDRIAGLDEGADAATGNLGGTAPRSATAR